MNNTNLIKHLREFISRAQRAGTVVEDEDEGVFTQITKLLAPTNLIKATNKYELMGKLLSKDVEAPTNHRYILVDKLYVCASDGIVMGICPNVDGIDTGIYDHDMNKVNYEGEINLTLYLASYLALEFAEQLVVVDAATDIRLVSVGPEGSIQNEYVEIMNTLKFSAQYMTTLLNGAQSFSIHYNKSDVPSLCRIVLPEFPDLTLITYDVVV